MWQVKTSVFIVFIILRTVIAQIIVAIKVPAIHRLTITADGET